MKARQNFSPPKPKEHGAWGMLYVPLLTAAGIGGNFNLPVFGVAVAVTLVFLSQRPLAQILTAIAIKQNRERLRRDLWWLAVYWLLSLSIFWWLYWAYQLVALPHFLWIATPIAVTFTVFVWKRRVRSVAGELTGICGLTLTAPLGHYAATGEIQGLGFWLWGLCILYFGSSVFYVKAVLTAFLKARFKAVAETAVTAKTCVLYHAGLVLALAGLVATNSIPPLGTVAFVPAIARGFWGVSRSQQQPNFARIGWAEVVYSLFFAVATILAMRIDAFAQWGCRLK